ncbi:DIS3 mitotic control, partial [Perkinsus olseni]
ESKFYIVENLIVKWYSFFEKSVGDSVSLQVVKRSEVPVVGVVRPGETKIQPRDQRLPAMDLVQPFSQVDEGVHLVACEIVEWDEASVNPKCKLVVITGRELELPGASKEC